MINFYKTDFLPSIVDLRRFGHKVRVSHFRNVVYGDSLNAFGRVRKIDKKNGVFAKILEHGDSTQIEFTNRDLARLAKQGAF